ncbi:MAG: cytidylate kinase [Alphaproteobacteria bacterium CG_4_10_14_0_8_um_filter_53_9]|nr:MAG: cytidylate kinase [Alphaproteobacteria bacterium CG_4_10_14_0_8_um_filter_53_9]
MTITLTPSNPDSFITLNGYRGVLDSTADLVRNPLSGIAMTVDGGTATGKGTLAKELARRYRVKFLDTGTIYRSVAWRLLDLGDDPTDPLAAEAAAKRLVFDFRHLGNNHFGTFVHGEDVTAAIRTPEVGRAAPLVAVQPAVRQALLDMQRDYVRHWQPLIGVVLDGRDTGARIAPKAQIKFFIQADAELRAHRRWLEFTAAGKEISEAQVLKDLLARDARDAENIICTPDAVVLDATDMDAAGVLRAAIAAVEERFGPVPAGILGED